MPNSGCVVFSQADRMRMSALKMKINGPIHIPIPIPQITKRMMHGLVITSAHRTALINRSCHRTLLLHSSKSLSPSPAAAILARSYSTHSYSTFTSFTQCTSTSTPSPQSSHFGRTRPIGSHSSSLLFNLLNQFQSHPHHSIHTVTKAPRPYPPPPPTEPKPPLPPFNIPFPLIALALFVSYYFYVSNLRSTVLGDSALVPVSPTEDELKDLLQRTSLKQGNILKLYRRCLQLYPSGLLKLEQFCDVVTECLLPEDLEKVKPNWHGWELISLFRNSPIITDEFYDIRELMIGITQLLAESKNPDSPQPDDPTIVAGTNHDVSKLEMAWTISDEDHDGKISFNECQLLIDRMIRTGHFQADSLLIQTHLWYPKFEFLDGKRITQKIFEEHSQHTVEFYNHDFNALPEQSRVTEESFANNIDYKSIYDSKISWPQFVSSIRSLTVRQDASIWYLSLRTADGKDRAGIFKRYRKKWTERYLSQWHKYTSANQDIAIHCI